MVHFNSFNKISKYTLDSYKSVLIIQIKQYIYMFKTAINSFFWHCEFQSKHETRVTKLT